MVRQLVDVSRWAPNASNDQIIDWIAVDDSGQIARLSVEVATTLGGTARLLQNSLLRPFLYVMYGRTKIQEALSNVQDFQRLAENSAQGLDPIFYGAPVVLVAHAPKGAYFGREDALYASYNLMLATQRLGLGTCHIGWFNVALERNPGLQDILGLPPERQIEVVLILGYPRFKFGRALPRRQMALAWNPG
jgi:nitroreductase